ncbi:MAG: type III glutamate--ammonia ligase, partial [Pseudomonadota bacterium]
HMVRIPDDGRFEVRLADGAVNPYLMPAALLAAGRDGMKNKRDPGKRVDLNMYTEGHKVRGAKKLPLNLLDALREMKKSTVLKDALGEEFMTAYQKLRGAQWLDYTRHLTQWERDNTLDC